jgi:hypothetical protein
MKSGTDVSVRVMKTRGDKTELILTSAPDEGEWSVSGSGLFSTRKSASRKQ